MPDRRAHRGPHPEDAEFFAPEQWPALRAAVADLCWLLDRGYPLDASTKLVGDRHRLSARQRTAVQRCVCTSAQRARRLQHQVSLAGVAGETLWIDGYNVLTTIEAALAGGILLLGRDGCLRDMASMHGSYRKVAETVPALEAIGGTTAACGVAACVWYLDRPVSNSGRLKQMLEQVASAHGWDWRVELVANPDPLLATAAAIVATADSAILNQCAHWVNLARAVVEERVAGARVLDVGLT